MEIAIATNLSNAFEGSRVVKALDRKLADIELSKVEIDEAVELVSDDLSRVLSYPVSEPKPVEAERTDFGHGLMERITGLKAE